MMNLSSRLFRLAVTSLKFVFIPQNQPWSKMFVIAKPVGQLVNCLASSGLLRGFSRPKVLITRTVCLFLPQTLTKIPNWRSKDHTTYSQNSREVDSQNMLDVIHGLWKRWQSALAEWLEHFQEIIVYSSKKTFIYYKTAVYCRYFK